MQRPTTEDINYFHAGNGHLGERSLRATTNQQNLRLSNSLLPCESCISATGRRALCPPRTTSRATAPLESVFVDTAGPFQLSHGGARYLVAFVDNFSRRGNVYGMPTKADTVDFLQKFIADVGAPQCLRMDNAGENTSHRFASCDARGIRREYNAPHTGQQNAPVESSIWRVLKGAHAARLDIPRLFPSLDFGSLARLGDDVSKLWMEAALWACQRINRSATTADPGMLSPDELFFGLPPPLQIAPFFQPGVMWVERARKEDVRARRCFYLNGGMNHSSSCVKVLHAASWRVCHTKDVVWTLQCARTSPLLSSSRGGDSAASDAVATSSAVPVPASAAAAAGATTTSAIPVPTAAADGAATVGAGAFPYSVPLPPPVAGDVSASPDAAAGASAPATAPPPVAATVAAAGVSPSAASAPATAPPPVAATFAAAGVSPSAAAPPPLAAPVAAAVFPLPLPPLHPLPHLLPPQQFHLRQSPPMFPLLLPPIHLPP